MNKQVDLAIIGAGPAGLAAAVAAYEQGVKNIVILERDQVAGGILNQCIHNGFGLHIFSEELTGPEYADRFIQKTKELGLDINLNTMVLDIDAQKNITTVSSEHGICIYKAKVIVLAMGCRERTRGSVGICGNRPSGVFTAGSAQYMVNMQGYLPGKKVVILGSGDIGLIMARRLTLEGASVPMVIELMPYSSGLKRNVVQCLNDFDIPLKLNHTVVQIHGKQRLEGVTIAKVNEDRKPILETKTYVPCDTLLLSVGLIPENELTENMGIVIDPITHGAKVDQDMQTSMQGVFACGNVLHVHDLVDYVTDESSLCGKSAANYILKQNQKTEGTKIFTKSGENVRYIVPHIINTYRLTKKSKLYFRVTQEMMDVTIKVTCGEHEIYRKKQRKVAPSEMCSILMEQLDVSAINEDIEIQVTKEVI